MQIKDTLSISLCQFSVVKDKEMNSVTMETFVREAYERRSKIACLPEMWNCPYTHKYFKDYSEDSSGKSVYLMSDLAKKYSLYLVGGSIPERDNEKIYNTSFIFNPMGELIAKHRKAHLFDVDIKGGHKFFESETFSAGDSLTVFESEFGEIGVAICYDIRFPEMFSEMRKMGCKLIFLPAAFNMTTGPAHWELLCRARAIDNQIYFAACGQGRDENSPFTAYGNSMIVNPWGEISGKAGGHSDIVTATIDFKLLNKIRSELPILKNETQLFSSENKFGISFQNDFAKKNKFDSDIQNKAGLSLIPDNFRK